VTSRKEEEKAFYALYDLAKDTKSYKGNGEQPEGKKLQRYWEGHQEGFSIREGRS